MSSRPTLAPPTPDSDTTSISAPALQRAIDQAAYFNIFSIPDRNPVKYVIVAPDDSSSVIGMKVREVWHRFQVIVQPPTAKKPLTARNLVGEPVGRFTHRWLLAPDDWEAAPDREPPPTPLDTSRSQRFVMLDSLCSFGHGESGFRGFGTGQTIPISVDGQTKLLITAIGTVLEGFGTFKGVDFGTYVYCGGLTPQHAYTGNVMLRVNDPQGILTSDSDLSQMEIQPDPEPDTTYIVFRGQAVPSDAVTPRADASGQPLGLVVHQGLRLLDLDLKKKESGRLLTTATVGSSIGDITATVTFNPASAPGSNLAPIPFLARDEFRFTSPDSEVTLGTFQATSDEGRVFDLLIAGTPGIRFGGTGRILTGTGPFEDINGLMTDNSVVAFNPHVSASVYVLRVHDPQGRFRSAAVAGRKP